MFGPAFDRLLEGEGERDSYNSTIRLLRSLYGERSPYLGYLEAQLARDLYVRGGPSPGVLSGLVGGPKALGRRSLSALNPDERAAFDHALAAEQILREQLFLDLRTLTEEQALRLARNRQTGLDVVLTLAAQGLPPADVARAWDAVVRSRSAVLEELTERHREAADDRDTLLASLSAALADARAQLAALSYARPGEDAIVQARELKNASARARLAEERLARASARFRAHIANRRVGLTNVVRALPSNAALLAFVQYRNLSWSRSYEGRHPSVYTALLKHGPVPSTLAFVVVAGGDPVAIPLGRTAAIDSLVEAWQAEASGDPNAPGAEERYRAAAQALRTAVWDPVEPALAGARRVIVVGDGALDLVGFDALPERQGGYLIENGPVFSYLGAERELVDVATASRTAVGLLAVGAVDFDQPGVASDNAAASARRAATRSADLTECSDLSGVRFTPLPATGREIREIVHLWRADRDGAADILQGAAADKAAFIAQAHGRRVIHVATHGFFAGECATPLGSDVRGPEWLRRDAGPLAATNRDPMLLSGLAFAGANRDQEGPIPLRSGILTAAEVAALDLTGTELAVLSACQTGLGVAARGEGVLGLRRAFRVAGVDRQIVSLWRVDDESTRRWMNHFYQHAFGAGEPIPDAAHAAALQMLLLQRAAGNPTHPSTWAAFLALGP